MLMKTKQLQPSLFNLNSPPVRNVPPPPPREDKERVFAEELRRSGPMRDKPIVEAPCSSCGLPYVSLSYHLLNACVAPVAQATPEVIPIPRSTPEVQPAPETIPAPAVSVARQPHWWHWVRPSSTGSKAQEPFTPKVADRRRSIPSIACSLYSYAWALFATKESADNAGAGYVEISRRFYEADREKVEKLIALLVFCDVPEDQARSLARRAWQDAKEDVFQQWSKGAGRKLLRLVGYELGEKEPDGSFDSAAVCFADVAQEEGVTGR